MRKITIDCETLPTALPFEDRKFWETEEEYRKTALDGNLGRLLCIGYIQEFTDGSPLEYGCIGWNKETESFETDEAVILVQFWELMRGFNIGRDLIIGHNILCFDLPFILQRSIINGVRPTVNFSFYRYQKNPIFDTMLQWDCGVFKKEGSTGLEKLAFALGLPSPKEGGTTGASIYDTYLEGRFHDIYEYCMRDVKTTRNIYRRMHFTYPTCTKSSEPIQMMALTT